MKKENIRWFLTALLIISSTNLTAESWSDSESKDGIVYLKKTNLPFTGVLIQKYPNGEMKSSASYENGVRHGQYLSWHKNGKMCAKYNYKNGCRDGKFTSWFESGVIWLKAEFKDNATVGNQTTYYSTGEKCGFFSWNKGKQSFKTWDKKGNLISEGTSFNGEAKEGTFCNTDYEVLVIEKYAKGKLISTTEKNGKSIDLTKLKKNNFDKLKDPQKIQQSFEKLFE